METSYIIFNAFGAGNLGDDLLLKAAISQYSIDKIRMAVGFGPPLLKDAVPFITYDEYFASSHLSPAYKDNAFVIYGGALLWSPENLAVLCMLAADRAVNTPPGEQTPFDVVSIGLQGSGFYKPVVTRLASLARHFSVRDTSSAHMLEPGMPPLEVVDDPVYTMLKRKKVASSTAFITGDRITIGLAVGGTWFNDDPHKAAHLIEILGTLNHFMIEANTGLPPLRFLFIPHVQHRFSSRESDTLVGPALAQSKIGGAIEIVPFPKYAEDLPDIYRTCDLVLSNRFHGLAIPHALGIPVVGLDWDNDKVTAYCLDHQLPLFSLNTSYEDIARALAAEIHALYKRQHVIDQAA